MSLLAVRGTYENGHIFLEEKISHKTPISVIVTFLEEKQENSTKKVLSSFNFKKAQQLSISLKTSLTDALVEERRENK